jgi:shikimate dehydrogenase
MKLFGLIGFPLTHSWSEIYFTRKFTEEGIANVKYLLFELKDISELPALVRNNPNLLGFNVTIPYKEKIIPILDHIAPDALNIGAVNVVLVNRDTESPVLTGYNTDVEGFSNTLPAPFNHKQALILGTGGAAKAVASVLEAANVNFLFVSREKRGKNIITYRDLAEDRALVASRTFIVNATPAGMFPATGTAPEIPYDELTPAHFLYDLVYNPGITQFMARGTARGATVTNGYNMFTRQAEAAYFIFKKKIC